MGWRTPSKKRSRHVCTTPVASSSTPPPSMKTSVWRPIAPPCSKTSVPPFTTAAAAFVHAPSGAASVRRPRVTCTVPEEQLAAVRTCGNVSA